MFQLKWIWANMKGYRIQYILMLLLAVVMACMYTINPQLLSGIIDNVFVGTVDPATGETVQHLDMLIPSLLLVGLVTLSRTTVNYTMIMLGDRTSLAMITRVRTKIYENLQSQDMRFYDQNRTGDLMTRLTGDMDMVRHATAYIFRQLINCTVMFVATTIYFFSVHIGFTLCMLAVTPLMFFISTSFSKKIRPKYQQLRETLANLNTHAQENISGNHVVKAFAREDYEIKKFAEKDKEFHDANLEASFTWLKYYPFIETVAYSFGLMCVLIGGIFMIQGELTAGQLLSFYYLTWTLSEPMRQLGSLLNDLQRFFASASKVIEVYYSKSYITDRDDAVSSDERMRGEIEFSDVCFSYGRTKVFDHVSFKVKPGETLAIMGATGSGKTTLANLILRFYDVQSGEVRVDGRSVKQWALRTLRRNIGVATQDVFLFSDTVEGNIAYGDNDLTLDEVKEFARMADADFIDGMPDGYDTIIGERGVGLSGGQRQRLALARALAIRPPILIIDDTTSAVDLETERYIQNELEHLPFSCTKIIIAQRISSVKDADHIMILKDGRISEMGTHEELLANKGYYYDIFNLQNDNMALKSAAEGGEQ